MESRWPAVAGTRYWRWRFVAPAAAYFGLVFAIGFLLGSLRVPLLVPRLGVRFAELLEMPVMLVAVIWSARVIVRRFRIPPNPWLRLRVGLLAFCLLVASELLLAYGMQGLPPLDYVAGKDVVSGPIYFASLILFALMPLLVLRWPSPDLAKQ